MGEDDSKAMGNAKLVVHSWWGDDQAEAWTVRPKASITIKNATSKSVVLTAHNGFYSASVNLTVAGIGDNPHGPGGNGTSSNAWIWILVIVVAVLLVVGIVVGVKKFGGELDE